MPDWTAPFKMPRMTTEEFRKRKADYVAKYGYQITIPGFEDIIRLPVEKPLTTEEKKLWRARNYKAFSEERLEEIRYIKKRRKEKYLAMLASPTPEVFSNRASILTALDNTQDAVSTCAAVGLIAVKTLPRAVARVIAGPVGWLMAGANIMNLATESVSPERWGIRQKRVIDSVTDKNPKSQKLRLKYLDRLKKQRLNHGALIEAAQVTENVFGVGISLGQAMNLPIEIIAGNVRMLYGHRVSVKYPIPDLGHWQRLAAKAMKGYAASWGVYRGSDVIEDTTEVVGLNLMAQVTAQTMREYDALENVMFMDMLEVAAPYPDNPLLIEVMDEEDPDWRQAVGWPGTGKEWSTLNDIYDSSVDTMNDNFKRYCERNAHNFHGFIGAINATESAFYAAESAGGEGSVSYEYTAPCKIIHTLLDQGYVLGPDITEQQRRCFVSWLEAHERKGSCPTLPEALDFGTNRCGITWKRIITA